MTATLSTTPRPSQDSQPVKTPAHQRVYRQLRAMILFGDLAPGQAVTIQGLTAQLAAGMTPVREALRRLTAEGALTLQGNRRVIVPALTSNCLDELSFIRMSLEPELTRRAAARIDVEHLQALRTIDDQLNDAITKGDVNGYLTHNYRFHSMIYEAADAPIMAETVDRLWLRFGPSLRVVCGRHGTSNLPDKHADLLIALEASDVDGAVTAMTEDIEQGTHQVRAALADG